MRIYVIILAFGLALSGCASSGAQRVRTTHQSATQTFEPWSVSTTAPVVDTGTAHTGYGSHGGPGFIDFAFQIYSRYITRVDGARCEHRPTCSRYAVDAIKKHGYVLGSLLTIDRLLRAERSSTLRDLPIDKVEDGRHYFADPVENNDFFF